MIEIEASMVSIQPRIRDILYKLSLINGHTTYTRFIILGRSRTGSNYLRGLLNSHHQIVTYSEIFQNFQKETLTLDMANHQSGFQDLLLLRDDPIKFLETRIFSRYPRQIQAVGFKIFYYHAKNIEWLPVWEYLKNLPCLRIIHIKRKNLLNVYLSKKRAEITNKWIDTSNRHDIESPILLEYEECLMDFIKTRAWEEEYDQFFNSSPKLEVFYEDLDEDHKNQTCRIQDFLGVDYEMLTPRTYKQSHQPLSEMILNYVELKERFIGTPWSSFFND